MLVTIALLFIIHIIFALVVVVTILHHRREPTTMLAWVLAVTLLPFLGALAYLVLGENRVVRRARRKRHSGLHLEKRIAEDLRVGGTNGANQIPEDLQVIERLGRELAKMPAIGGNNIQVYHGHKNIYPALEDAIQTAKHHIHLEYYIWEDDPPGTRLRDLVIEKAKQGVECRVLLDSVGNFRLKKSFTQPFVDNGVKLHYFLPLYPLRRRRWSLHLRNHRKIAVFDGTRTILGSHNIGGDTGETDRHPSPWYDVIIDVKGPAALFAQHVFADDWMFAAGEGLQSAAYFPIIEAGGDSALQILPSGPDWEVRLPERVLFEALTTAKSTVRIVSPYFVPSSVVRMAMIQASFRGVRIMLVVPGQCDVALAKFASRSFYKELLDSGVEIFEFREGMIHSKIVTIDDRWYMLGSTNLDMRSFRLNFEVTAVGFDEDLTKQIVGIVDSYCAESDLVTYDRIKSCSKREALVQGGARLIAPFL